MPFFVVASCNPDHPIALPLMALATSSHPPNDSKVDLTDTGCFRCMRKALRVKKVAKPNLDDASHMSLWFV